MWAWCSDHCDISSPLQDPAVFRASMQIFSNSAEGSQPERFWVQIHRPIHTCYLEPKYTGYCTELWRELNLEPRMQPHTTFHLTDARNAHKSCLSFDEQDNLVGPKSASTFPVHENVGRKSRGNWTVVLAGAGAAYDVERVKVIIGCCSPLVVLDAPLNASRLLDSPRLLRSLIEHDERQRSENTIF